MFRRSAFLAAAALVFAMSIAPGDAFARAGSSTSSGSRGTRTYSAPPATNTAPSGAQPMQRSMTPQTAPSTQPGMAAPAPATAGSGFFSRSPFMSGLMGGLIGAGIGGLLFGGGMFGGMHGAAGFLGFLLQIFIIAGLGWLLWSLFFARRMQAAPAGGPAGYERTMEQNGGMGGAGGGRGPTGGPSIPVTPADYHAFEELLHGVQAAWSAHDLASLRQMASPEMVSYFAEQMSEQTSRGVVNSVTDVRLEQGDLAEAWAEPGREYATVAMRFSMIDVTRDQAGRVVEGDPARRAEATEFWTFLRAPGGHWVLSAIQQAR